MGTINGMTKAQAEIQMLLAKAGQARAEERYSNLASEKLEYDKGLREAAEYTNRIFTFDQEVKPRTVQEAIGTIGLWARQDPTRPIKIIFNSPGGSVFHGFALYDYILSLRRSGVQIDTEGIGLVASITAVLLQAGEKRILSPRAWFMIHELSSVKMLSIEKVSEEEDSLEFKKRLQSSIVDVLAERSKLDATEIKKRAFKTDWWLNADEALEAGFVDEVR